MSTNTPTVFIVRGNPTPKGRARAALARDSNDIVGIAHRTPNKTVRYEHDVKSAALRAHGSKPIFSGALKVHAEFRMAIPENWSPTKKAAAAAELIYHTVKPDLDNLRKAVNDACNGAIWKDDSFIVEESGRKFYSFEPCAIITVTPLDSNEF